MISKYLLPSGVGLYDVNVKHIRLSTCQARSKLDVVYILWLWRDSPTDAQNSLFCKCRGKGIEILYSDHHGLDPADEILHHCSVGLTRMRFSTVNNQWLIM